MGGAGKKLSHHTLSSDMWSKNVRWMMGLWINLCAGLPRSMDTKRNLIPIIFFLLAVLQGSRAQSPTPQIPAQSSVANTATMFTGSRVSRDANVLPELEPAEQTTRRIIDNEVSNTTTTASTASKAPDVETAMPETTVTPSPVHSVTPITSTTKKDTKNAMHQAAAWDTKWDEDFNYDYESLRIIGLSVAGFLFITGVMIISCDKVRQLPKCRTRLSRSYNVARQ